MLKNFLLPDFVHVIQFFIKVAYYVIVDILDIGHVADNMNEFVNTLVIILRGTKTS